MNDEVVNKLFKTVKIFDKPDEAQIHIINFSVGIALFREEWASRPTKTFLNMTNIYLFSRHLEPVCIRKEYQFMDVCSMYRLLKSCKDTNIEKLLRIPDKNMTEEKIKELRENKEKCIVAFEYITKNILHLEIDWESPEAIMSGLFNIS